MTIWTQEEQKKILSWPYVHDVAIFEADTKSKRVNKDGWQEEDYSKVDFKQRLESGLYDRGICLALGKTFSQKHYVFTLDFDGWDAIIAWFGGDSKGETWERVKALARHTRIEWHENFEDGKIHLILKSYRLLGKNRRIHIGNALLELRCDRQALFASPSIHKNGNRYRPLDTEDIEIIDNNDLLRIQAKIDSLSKDYMSDDDRQKYEDWLDLPTTILGANQGRHDATKFKVLRYFWKYSGEWLNYSDEQRFEKAWEWHLQHCTPPRSREEFDRICKWTIDTFREERDKKHEEARSKRNNYADMPGCVSYQINSNPDKFIVSTPDNKLVETIHKYEDSHENPKEKVCKVYNTKTFLCCKPVRIIKHRNPGPFLETVQKYTMVFKGSEPSGNFTLKQKSLSEIVARLKETDALCDKNIDNALIAQTKGFEQRGLLEVNDDMDYIGFFLDGNDKILSSGIEVKNEIRKADLLDALNFIEESKRYYDGRLDLLATSIKWGMVAPISFILKCKGKILKWLHFWGFSNASKSTTAKYILAIDGNHNNDAYVRNISNIDTIARLGDTIGKSTFPKLVDEVNLSGSDNTKYLINQFKSAIDHKILRSKFQTNRSLGATDIPALSPLILTSNSPPPTNDAAYMRRIIDRSFSQAESHESNSEISMEFEEFLNHNLHRLCTRRL